jgi:hypothetical protein
LVDGAASGGLVGGTVSSLSGGNFSDGFNKGAIQGGLQGAVMGGAQAGIQSLAQGQNPFTGKALNSVQATSSSGSSQEVEDIRSLLSKDQAKHTGGDPTRSQLFPNEDPASLIQEGMGRGAQVDRTPRGEFGFKERVTFNRNIGIYRSDPKIIGPVFQAPSSKGIIIYGKNGFHIYPGRP